MTAKPCVRCGVSPKEPGRGKKYCKECKEFQDLGFLERRRASGKASSERRRRSRGAVIAKHKLAPDGTKYCSRCDKYLAKAMFPPNRKKVLASYCRDCNPEVMHELRMKRVFGIDSSQYYAILDFQGGVCYICQRKPRKQKLAVDHDHKTGAIRGLLCTMCNHRVLGGAKDDIENLRRAIAYLENPPAPSAIGKVVVPVDGRRGPSAAHA